MDESHDPALSGCECHNPRLGTRTPLLAHPLGTSRGLCCCSFSLSSRIVSPLKISPGWVLHCWAQDLPCLYLPSPPKAPHRLRSQLETPQPFLPKFKGGSLVVWGHLEASPGFKGAGKGCCLSTVRGKSRGEGSEPQRGLQNPPTQSEWGFGDAAKVGASSTGLRPMAHPYGGNFCNNTSLWDWELSPQCLNRTWACWVALGPSPSLTHHGLRDTLAWRRFLWCLKF